jgi:hypothetical protein
VSVVPETEARYSGFGGQATGARRGVNDMPPEVGFFGLALIFFSLGMLFGALMERGRWERRIRWFAAYLERPTASGLKIEKDLNHTVATALRLFLRKRVSLS